jgi:hypothetical protein
MTKQEVAVHQLCPVFLLGGGGSPAPPKDLDGANKKSVSTLPLSILPFHAELNAGQSLLKQHFADITVRTKRKLV